MCNVNTGYCDCSPGFTGPSCDDGRKELMWETIALSFTYSQILESVRLTMEAVTRSALTFLVGTTVHAGVVLKQMDPHALVC